TSRCPPPIAGAARDRGSGRPRASSKCCLNACSEGDVGDDEKLGGPYRTCRIRVAGARMSMAKNRKIRDTSPTPKKASTTGGQGRGREVLGVVLLGAAIFLV